MNDTPTPAPSNDFDRGLDIGPADATTERLVACMCAKVADRVYPAGWEGAGVR